jgi:hypothetical protein
MTALPALAVAISVAAGVRCFDVRVAESCVTAQSVAVVGRYGEAHGSFLANYFPHGPGVVVGAAWGGDLGSPFYSFARDRVRFAVRLTLDMGVVVHDTTNGTRFDLDWATFALGPQLWVRLSPAAFFLVRSAVGGSFFIFNIDPPFGSRFSLGVSPTVDAALGFAFDLP